jgi:hypothetical protein
MRSTLDLNLVGAALFHNNENTNFPKVSVSGRMMPRIPAEINLPHMSREING